MSVLESPEITPTASQYEAPQFEVLGQLTDLAAGQGEGGLLIMQATGMGIPG